MLFTTHNGYNPSSAQNVNFQFYLGMMWQNSVSMESLIPQTQVQHLGVKCMLLRLCHAMSMATSCIHLCMAAACLMLSTDGAIGGSHDNVCIPLFTDDSYAWESLFHCCSWSRPLLRVSIDVLELARNCMHGRAWWCNIRCQALGRRTIY